MLIAVTAVLLAATLVQNARADSYGTTGKERTAMKALIVKHFGSGWRGQTMLCIASRESGYNPRAANYRDSNGGSYGLFQMNGVHRWRNESLSQFRARMWNPTTHMTAVVRLARGGLGPWRSTHGGC